MGSYNLHPTLFGTSKCTLMWFTNLAEPEWISTSCEEKSVMHLMCSKTTASAKTVLNDNKENAVNKLGCSETQFLMGDSCYSFIWNFKSIRQQASCRSKMIVLDEAVKLTLSLINAVQATFPVIVVGNEPDIPNMLALTFDRHLNVLLPNAGPIQQSSSAGFFICSGQKQEVHLNDNLFQCFSGGYISQLYLCDGTPDCKFDGSDEANCNCSNRESKSSRLLQNTIIPQSQKKTFCCDLYYLSQNRKCKKYYNSPKKPAKPRRPRFRCKHGEEIDERLFGDLHADCVEFADDEAGLKKLVNFRSTMNCTKEWELPCRPGHSKCYNLSEICSYNLDELGHLGPCRNGGHLENCLTFQCVQKFKCRFSYCVSWHVVCDGVWDCPRGEDEQFSHICGNESACVEMFKCHSLIHKCIHASHVCDGTVQCPNGDDEILCEECPEECQCLALAVTCKANQIHLAKQKYSHLYLSLLHVSIVSFPDVYNVFVDLLFLKLVANGLRDICPWRQPQKLYDLEVTHNNLTKLESQCFQSLFSLEIVVLNDNEIQRVESESFTDMPQLKHLGLSNNGMTFIDSHVATKCPMLKMLSVGQNAFDDLDVFRKLSIKYILTDKYYICCLVPENTTCIADRPWHVSCADILPTQPLKIVFKTNSLFIFIVSCLCFAIHVLMRNTGQVFCLTVGCFNVSDLLCSIFLIILWAIDLQHAVAFAAKEEWWRSSFGCFTVLFLSLLYVLLNQLVFILLSLTRLMVVLHPIDSDFKRVSFVGKSLGVVFVCAFIISVIVTVNVAAWEKAMSTSLCSCFEDPTDSSLSVQVVVWFLSVFQPLATVGIILMHIGLVYNLFQSQKNIQKSKSKDSNVAMVVQLVTTTVTNILCCFSTSAVFLSALLLPKYPLKMTSWTIVSPLPLNSLICPTVFIVVSLRKHWKEKKK